MHRQTIWKALSILGLLLSSTLLPDCSQVHVVEFPPPPKTELDIVVDDWHGEKVEDPYRWLEDQNAPPTRDWIDRQNAYTDGVLGQLLGQEELRETVTKLLKIDTLGMPTERGGRYFFSKRRADQPLSVLYYREGLKGEDRVLIDPHSMSEDHTVSVGFGDISRDGRLVVYVVRKGGADEVEIRLRNVDSGEDLPDVLPTARYGSLGLTPDCEGFYYAVYGGDQPRISYHLLGQDPTSDKVLFGEGFGKQHILSVDLSDDGEWLLVHVIRGSSGPSQIFLKNLKTNTPFKKIFDDGRSRSFAAFAGGQLIISTNQDAPNTRLMVSDLENPEFQHWREVIPEPSDAVIRGVSPVGGMLFVSFLRNVIPQVILYDVQGSKIREIETETLGSVGLPTGEWTKSEAFFGYSSFHEPPVIYRYDVERGRQEIWAKIEIPVDTEQMEVKQVRFHSKDGTMIPMFIVHRKDLRLTGDNPTLLTGYGGFRSSLTPGFRADAAAWLQQGGVYAVANLRGGGEFGEEWHMAGMLNKKQSVFDDFISASEFLIRERYTRPRRLAIQGGSNGGLLVGAAMVQRPDLFGAVVCSYPLLDMLRYHKFLVGSFWVSEYGSAENPEQFQYLKAYSPYHNVAQGVSYPAVLFITGDADTRVDPCHARKMAALVQARNGGDNPVLLRYHTKAGHSGGQPVDDRIDQMVEILSFLKWRLGS